MCCSWKGTRTENYWCCQLQLARPSQQQWLVSLLQWCTLSPPVALPWASMHWSVQCCSVAFLWLLPVSLVIVVALWTVFVNSTKIRGSVLLSCQCTTSTRSHHNLLWGVLK